jgi:hypothetical protein
MKDWLALKPLLGLVCLLAIFLIGLRFSVAHDTATLVPSPEMTAKHFLRELKIHNYRGAEELLSIYLRPQLDKDGLRSWVKESEARGRAIDQAEENGFQAEGVRAQASVRVKLAQRQEEVWHFTLVKEKGLWKIDSCNEFVPHKTAGG